MRVIFAKTLLVVFLAILPFKQALSQDASGVRSSTVNFFDDFGYRFTTLYSLYATGFCLSKNNNCVIATVGFTILTVGISYSVEGTARKRCNKKKGASSWCALPGAERDLDLQR